MRIEQVTIRSLEKADDDELKELRLRFIQLWEKHFKGSRIERAGWLNRADLIRRYKLLKKEMLKRDLNLTDVSALDNHIFSKALYNFDVSEFGDIVVTQDVASIGGSYVKDPIEAQDVDVILRKDTFERDESTELKLSRELYAVLEKDIHFIYSPKGPHSTYIPIFDLVLRAKRQLQKIEVVEGLVKSAYSCKYCKAAATYIYIWADGRAYIPVCNDHRARAKYQIEEKNKDNITTIKRVNEFKKTDEAKEALDERELEYRKFRQLDEWDENRISDFAAVVKELAPGTILELGCGTAKFLKALRIGGRNVFGIDDSDIALSIAKMNSIEVMKRDLNEALPFDNNSWDNVISLHTLEHLNKPEMLISEAQRVAKEKVMILTPLGTRFCSDHKQEFKNIEEYKKLFPDPEWRVEDLQYFSAIAVYEKPERLKKTALKPLQRFKPTKFAPSTGYTESEFFDYEKWAKWAEKYLEEGGIGLEMKYGGYHTVLEADEKGKTLIYFEDAMKDKSDIMPEVVDDLKTIGKSIILDADMGMKSKKGHPLPRVDLAFLAATKTPIEGWYKIPTREAPESRIDVHVYDILYYDGRDIHDLEFHERRKILKKLFGTHDFKTLQLSPVIVVKNKKSFISTAKKLSALPGSEGAVAKWMNFKYPIYPKTTPTTSKYKKSLELKFKVIKVVPTATAGTVNLEIGYGDGDKIVSAGKTFNTKLKAKAGDIVTVTVDEVMPIKEKEGWRLGFVSPAVQDLETAWRKPEQMKSIIARADKKGLLQVNEVTRAQLKLRKEMRDEFDILKVIGFEKAKEGAAGEFGNIDFKLGAKGTGVLQVHIMGIEEDKVEALERDYKSIMIASGDLKKLKSVLLRSIGEQGAHLDIRLRPGKEGYWEGGEFMIGNISGLPKLTAKGRKLRFGWKQSRADEPKIKVIRGALGWMKAGKGKPEIFAPGQEGSTANKHAAMMVIDTFTWEIYQADEHAKKFKFENRFMSGNWLFAFVPITPEDKKPSRIWMASKLKDSDYQETTEEEKKLEKVICECIECGYIIRSEITADLKCSSCGGEMKDVERSDDEDVLIEKQENVISIFKIDDDERIVGGIVYEPMEVDAHTDFASAADIRKACYYFMEHSQQFKLFHEGSALGKKVHILENYLAPDDFVINKQKVKKGSWLLVTRVLDERIWKGIKEGKINAFSMAGRGRRIKKAD